MAAEPLEPLPGRPVLGPLKEGLTPPLRAWLLRWVEKRLIDPREAGDRVFLVATALNVPPVDAYGDGDVLGWLETYWAQGDEQLLDVVHATLHVLDNSGVAYRPPHPYVEVERQLAYGRSLWEAKKAGLIRRVDPTAQAAFERALTPGDADSGAGCDTGGSASGSEPRRDHRSVGARRPTGEKLSILGLGD